MNNRLLMSVAAAALIAGSGIANAQNAGMSREAPGSAAKSAPAADRTAPQERAAPVNKDEATDTMKRSESGSDIKAAPSDDKMKRDDGSQRASDGAAKAGTASSESRDPSKAGKDVKAEGRAAPDAKGADAKSSSTETKSTTTTGQAGAGAKLSTDQRTKITTTIKQQNIKPVTHVNFSISVGTRVPRDVEFHPLPTEIVTIYPDWRGYEFILVNDQILVINPGTYEIVAVLDA